LVIFMKRKWNLELAACLTVAAARAGNAEAEEFRARDDATR
jgi:hypothetical protein